MPDLKEYILTLKKYNPTTPDKVLKIYLLKAGWPAQDIESMFSDLFPSNSVPTTPEVVPVSSEIPKDTLTTTDISAKHPTTEIEVASPELLSPELAKPFYPQPESIPVVESPVLDTSIDSSSTHDITPLVSMVSPNITTTTTTNTVSSAPRKLHKHWLFWVIVILMCAVIAVGYLKFIHGVYVFARPALTTTELQDHLDQVGSAMQNLKYEMDLRIEKDNDLNGISDKTALLSLAVKGIHEVDGIKTLKEVNIQGNYTEEGISQSIDVDTIDVYTDKYMRINDFPKTIADATPVKGMWFTISSTTPSILSGIFEMEIVSFIKKSLTTGEIRIVSEPKKAPDNKSLYEYEVIFVPKSIPQDNSTEHLIINLATKGKLRMYTTANGDIDHIALDGIIQSEGIDAPATTSPASLIDDIKTPEVKVSLNILFKKIDRNSSIVAPSPIPEMDGLTAYLLLTNQDKDWYMYKDTVNHMSKVRTYIKDYQLSHASSVPDTLIPSLTSHPSYVKYEKKSDQEFSYIYNISLPEKPRKITDLQAVYLLDAQNALIGKEERSLAHLRTVPGNNTANMRTDSVEADLLKKMDKDKDRVTDALEIYIGSDSLKKDTDADGTNDYEELIKGGNLRGGGGWESEISTVNN